VISLLSYSNIIETLAVSFVIRFEILYC